MPTTAKCILAISTVLSICAVGLYLVYVTGFRYIFPLPGPRALEGSNALESVNNGRNTTDRLAYNHLTRS